MNYYLGKNKQTMYPSSCFEASKFFIGILALFLSANCKSIDPLPFNPVVKPEFAGIYEKNTYLKDAKLVAKGKINGLESLDLDEDGNIYGGDAEGNIIKINSLGEIFYIANTGGRPLGVQFDKQQKLIVADAYKGLLSISKKGEIQILVDEFHGEKLKFTDDLDISSDGKIYFSDASIYEQKDYLYDLLEARPHGRVFVYDPKTKNTSLLLDGLYFANGIALSENEDFLLINETYRYRITKLWLKGKNSGKSEILIENLPGFPDNITRNEKGEFWVSLFTVRNDRMDKMHPSVWTKLLISKLPKFLWPKPEPFGFVLKLDESGNPIKTLMDPEGKNLKEITSAIEKKGKLYIGSLYMDRIGVYDLRERQ